MHKRNKMISFGLSLAIVFLTAQLVQAQTSGRQADRRVQAAAQPAQKCLRALDGSCTNPQLVEAARLRAIIIPTVRVSYDGTPAGTVGGEYITFERLFRDNDKLFGLPTNTFIFCATCIFRSK
jgi:hypothetical protein